MTAMPPAYLTRRVLHLGSGEKYDPDAVNVDVVAATSPDVVHNLDELPWPLPSNHFKEVHAYDVLEHLTDIVPVMEEIHRVCQVGAVVKITVPHFSCFDAFTDPTHKHYFAVRSFDYFTGEKFGFYSQCRFEKRASNIVFHPGLVNKAVSRLARRSPYRYEQRWAWMFPAWFLYFELVKSA